MIHRQWFENEWTRHDTKVFEKNVPHYLFTTRFNNKTYNENKIGKGRLGLECYYTNYRPLSNVKYEANIYVLELNIEENKIMGIGMIKNNLQGDVYRIYEDDFYNRRYFASKTRIYMENFDDRQKQLISDLEDICFRGRSHLKRGHRMLRFPTKFLGLCFRNNLDVINELIREPVREPVREP
jgi:hypothetical protein